MYLAYGQATGFATPSCAQAAGAGIVRNIMLRAAEACFPMEDSISTKTQAQLIVALGGAKKVSELIHDRLGKPLRPQAVSQWRRRGIPYRYRATLAIEARERGIGVPPGFLGEPQGAA